MTGRHLAERVFRRAASATLLAFSVLSILAPVPLSVAAAPAANAVSAPVAASSPLTISLTTISPTVAVPRAPITITGVVRNGGRVPIASPVARALLGQRSLTSRQAVSAWADSSSDQTPSDQSPSDPPPADPPLADVARASLGKILAPGSATKFTITIPATAISHRESFAVLPLRVEIVGTTPTTQTTQAPERGDVHTFLPALATIKAYEPLSVAWLVPLTLDPDPALHGMNSPARNAAWANTLGPGSRLDRLIQGTEGAQVTWAIDPAILGPRQPSRDADTTGGPSPKPSASVSSTPGTTATPDPVAEATTALSRRLKAAAPRHTLWALPYADPDFSALSVLAPGNPVLTALISRPSTLVAALGPARTDIAWPVEGTLTPKSEAELQRAFGAPRMSAAVTSASTLAGRNGSSGDASRKSSTGLPLLAYDEALSRTFARTAAKTDGTLTIQRFLADSMALLGERPGTPDRSLLVAAPRTFAGDPAVLRSFFTAVAKAPWLSTTTTSQLLEASAQTLPEIPDVGTTDSTSPTGSTASPPPGPTPPSGGKPAASDPLRARKSPLTSGRLEAIPGTLSAITGIASILDDAQLFRVRWSDAQYQLVSARWRGRPNDLTAIEAATTAATSAISRSINVAPSSVNFFADKGVLQVTVVNTLAVPIHDVHLTLNPAQPRLRIEQQPGALRIGAKSRTNVPLRVTSIAAGLVPIEAVLTTRNGTPLGQSASVDVRVQPTATWIYWVLGGLAGVVLVLGTYRSLRRGSTRGSRPEAQTPGFDD